MFREMRRNRQRLSDEKCISILNSGSSGVLAVIGDDDYPYAVPLSYVYYDSKIYFHSAKSGHKTDAIAKNSKASFCVIDCDCVIPEKYTTAYRSVIVFGRIRILDNDEEKRAAITRLADKYSPKMKEKSQQEIEREYDRFCMVELQIEHMTGKEGIELLKENKTETPKHD
ncbi:MAG: pyridoxamine 5'-phosphate oxidase family protein [Acutalibacteraceae bacterium]